MLGDNLAVKTLRSYQWIGRRVSSPYAGVHRSLSALNGTGQRVSSPYAGVHRMETARDAVYRVSSPYAGVHRRCPMQLSHAIDVSSPYAGVHRPSHSVSGERVSSPYAGVHRLWQHHAIECVSSPYAGVHRAVRLRYWRSVFPVRGGSPMAEARRSGRCLPRTRGFTGAHRAIDTRCRCVFPVRGGSPQATRRLGAADHVSSPYAGVHRTDEYWIDVTDCIFPVRGGSPFTDGEWRSRCVSSPYAGVK